MPATAPGTITSIAALEALYAEPSERVRTKKRDHLDPGYQEIIGMSPFVLLATADNEGRCDVSPRGGPVGFVKVLDDRHVALPDLNGNHLIDSLRNIVANGRAGLLVVVPGQNDAVRIDGRAHLTTDAAVLDLFVDELRRPTLAVVIEIEHVFGHCAKAFKRGRVWDTSSWRPADDRVVLAARHRQLGLEASLEEYVASYDCSIDADLALDAPPT
jgi:uncharacterized protein